MTTYEIYGDHIIPEPVARALDYIAWYHRAYPPPDYATRCRLLAQNRAECKTDAQRQLSERNTDPSHASPNGKAPE